jgi:hypothetical protein
MTDDRRPGSDLPAVYESPWRRLAADLVAVLASLRLRGRELLRRNGEGSLWRPFFWPASRASWFWPLLLAALLGVLLLGVAFAGREAPLEPSSQSPLLAVPEPPVAAEPPETVEEPLAAEEPPVPAEQPAVPTEPPAEMDPLFSILRGEGAGSMLGAAQPLPARSLLVLSVEEPFSALPKEERRSLAERWWRRARELGYERLEVRDGRRRLLARTALVGEGLLWFDPPAPNATAGDRA